MRHFLLLSLWLALLSVTSASSSNPTPETLLAAPFRSILAQSAPQSPQDAVRQYLSFQSPASKIQYAGDCDLSSAQIGKMCSNGYAVIAEPLDSNIDALNSNAIRDYAVGLAQSSCCVDLYVASLSDAWRVIGICSPLFDDMGDRIAERKCAGPNGVCARCGSFLPSLPASDFSQFSGTWTGKGLTFKVNGDGTAETTWYLGISCTADNPFLCDTFTNGQYVPGGRATLVFSNPDGASLERGAMSSGAVIASSDPDTLSDKVPVTLALQADGCVRLQEVAQSAQYDLC